MWTQHKQQSYIVVLVNDALKNWSSEVVACFYIQASSTHKIPKYPHVIDYEVPWTLKITNAY